jgi:two-component sensor histidine kinase
MKPGRVLAFLIEQDLDDGEPRGVVDGDVYKPEGNILAPASLIFDNPQTDARDAGEFLSIQVDPRVSAGNLVRRVTPFPCQACKIVKRAVTATMPAAPRGSLLGQNRLASRNLSNRFLTSTSRGRWPFALIAAIVVPILVFAVTVSLLLDRQDRLAAQQQLEIAARSTSAAVNLKLAGEVATLETIAVAIDLPEGVDPPALHEVRRVIEAEPAWLGLRLSDPVSGQTIVHLGQGLDNEPGVEPEQSATLSGNVRIGGVRRPEAEVALPYVPIQVPITRLGRISHSLTAFVRADAFSDLLDDQNLPSGWIAGILDAEGKLVGLSQAGRESNEQIGTNAARSVVERIKRSPGTLVFAGKLLDWPMYFAVRHSTLSGWIAFVGVPAEVIEQPLRRHRAVMIAAGGVAVLLTLGLAGTLLRSTARLREEQAMVRQKDVLLREIRHRIKNNLQIISSLINLQADRAKLPETQRELGSIARRVRALHLVHEQLHPALTDGAIDLAIYLERLCDNILTLHGRASRSVQFLPRLQSMVVEADVAAPVGLIVSEALTNSLKHAFPRGGTGTVRITLERAGPGQAVLELADDGVGLPRREDRHEGVGLSLIEALGAQTGGELSWQHDGGTVLRLRFPLQT